MGAHLSRALILFEQSRYDLAERELRQELVEEPDSPMAHALFGLCLCERKDYAEATEAAKRAISLAPDLPFAHFVLARIFSDRNRFAEAEAAVTEAIRLDPEDPDHYALHAGILYSQKRWQEALEAAEQGLALDAEHVNCTNLRAMALVKLGRKKEAGATIEAALAKDPDNAVTHANQGWALLERGDHRKALEHFREALRLDPELDWARAGIVESLKARYLVYRLMLRYFLWMASLRARAQWALIIGLFVLYWVLRHVADANPDLAPWIWPVLYAYIGFAVMGWLADPLFNLLLRLNRFGRLALSPDQVRASNWVGGCLLVALLALGAWLVTGYLIALGLALNAGLLIIPIAATFRCEAGWPRDWMAIYTSVLAVLGAVEAAAPHVTIFLMVAADLPPGTARQILYVLLWTFLGGVILSEWVANGLMSIRPKL